MLPINAKVSTVFGVKCCGSTGRPHYWSNHIHKGADFAAPAGTSINAVWGGTVVDVSWGSAFGTHVIVDTDTLPDGTAGLWVGYMHMSKKVVKAGDRVKAGQKLGEVGQTGNATGNHLHLEVQASKSWSATGYRDPAKWFAATAYTYLQDKKVYESKMVYGTKESDSVKNLQIALNERSNAGLPVTGGFYDATRAATVKWQQKQGWSGADADGIPGPGTIKSLGLVWVDDSTDTPPPVQPVTNHVAILKAMLAEVSDVEYVTGWDNPDVSNGNGGTFSPEYVIMHHTAGTNSLSTLKPGGTYPKQAAANFLVRKDGRIYVVSAFKAFHAGLGQYGDIPKDKMNDFSWGIEIESLGTAKDMPQVQIDAAADLAGRLVKMMDSPIEKIINHKTYSSTGKPDTLYTDKFWQDAASDVEDYLTEAEANKLYLPITYQPPTTGGNAKDWSKYSGKPANYVEVGATWKKLDVSIPANPIGGEEFRMLYARVVFADTGFNYWTGTGMAKVECKWVRDGGTPNDTTDDDPTAYDERHYENGTKSVPFQMIHFEEGEAKVGGAWYMKVHGGASKMRVTTRYSKGWAIKVQ